MDGFWRNWSGEFLKKLWRAVYHHIAAGEPGILNAAGLNQTQKDLRRKTHETIKKSATISAAARYLTPP